MFENAPTTLLVAVVSLLLTVFRSIDPPVLNGFKTSGSISGEIATDGFSGWGCLRLLASQFRYSHVSTAIIGCILLYSTRHLERQLGLRKFGSFFFLSYFVSLLFVVGVVTLKNSMDLPLKIVDGPFFFAFALLPFYYRHIPKIQHHQLTIFGVEFSEKSWIYLLAIQFAFCEGFYSLLAAAAGVSFGQIYLSDSLGFQSFRLPLLITRPFGFVGGFVATLLPFGGITPRPGNAPTALLQGRANNNGYDQQQQRRFGDVGRGGGGGGVSPGGIGMPFRRTPRATGDGLTANTGAVSDAPAAVPPSEEAIASLINLGFERADVIRALERTNNNVEAAANILLR